MGKYNELKDLTKWVNDKLGLGISPTPEEQISTLEASLGIADTENAKLLTLNTSLKSEVVRLFDITQKQEYEIKELRDLLEI